MVCKLSYQQPEYFLRLILANSLRAFQLMLSNNLQSDFVTIKTWRFAMTGTQTWIWVRMSIDAEVWILVMAGFCLFLYPLGGFSSSCSARHCTSRTQLILNVVVQFSGSKISSPGKRVCINLEKFASKFSCRRYQFAHKENQMRSIGSQLYHNGDLH